MILEILFDYTEKDIKDVNYLLILANEFDCLDEVKESIFQFNPRLTGKTNTSHEPWPEFHKEIILNEIIFQLLEICIDDEYKREEATDMQIWHGKYSNFLTMNNFSNSTKEDIIKEFNIYLRNSVI